MRCLPVLLAIPLAACAVDPDDVPDGEDGTGDTDETTEDKADSATELRARIDGLTVWVDRAVQAGDVWVIEGRASRNLAGVHAWVPDDAFGEAAIVGPRRFAVTLRDGHEQNTLASGMPIFVHVAPVTGEPAEAAIWLAPRMTGFAGSSAIYVHTTIRPVSIGGELVYRGGATTTTGWGALTVATPSEDAPDVTAVDARHFRIDWSFGAIAEVAAQGAIVELTARRDAEVAEKTASVALRAVRVGLTRLDPRAVWEPSCDAEVLACLEALPDGALDTGDCGDYRDVQVCSAQ